MSFNSLLMKYSLNLTWKKSIEMAIKKSETQVVQEPLSTYRKSNELNAECLTPETLHPMK
jgi:hypothetical protein